MRILLTNDDGIGARGLALLEQVAQTLSDDVWVVAPADEQSGAGHSLTFTRPVRVRKHGEHPERRRRQRHRRHHRGTAGNPLTRTNTRLSGRKAARAEESSGRH